MYRLLKRGEKIKAGDEFLEDDCITWTKLPIDNGKSIGATWMIGMTWDGSAFVPFRRLITPNT